MLVALTLYAIVYVAKSMFKHPHEDQVSAANSKIKDIEVREIPVQYNVTINNYHDASGKKLIELGKVANINNYLNLDITEKHEDPDSQEVVDLSKNMRTLRDANLAAGDK